MSGSLTTPWNEQIQAAQDEAARRALLAEIGGWRATRLTDIQALRQAAYAMSAVYESLGQKNDALREAQSLMSLCQVPPEPAKEELREVKARLAQLQGRKPPKQPKKATASKERRDTRSDRSDPVTQVEAGAFDAALEGLRGRRGPRAQLTRTYVLLARALQADADAQPAMLDDLLTRLRRWVGGTPEPAAEAAPRVDKPEPAEDTTSPLAQLLGRGIPNRRRAVARLLEAFAEENPDKMDDLAATALEHHVATAGLRTPAPWLAGIVGRALASEAPQTRATVASLRSKGAYAVTAYDEWPFQAAVDVIRHATADGWDVTSLRRGVIPRSPLGNRRLWTIRMVKDFAERMLAIAPPDDRPFPPDQAATATERLGQLSKRCAMWAPGPGNNALRDAAIQSGIPAADDVDAAGALATVAALPEPSESAAPPEPTPKPRAQRRDADLDTLRELMGSDADVDALAAVLEPMRRRFRAFRVAREILAEGPADVADTKVARLLTAIDKVSAPNNRLPEGITIAAMATAALSEPGACAETVTSGPAAARFGGAGIGRVFEVARALTRAELTLHRVTRGTTGKERNGNEVLGSLGEDLGGLWRIDVRSGERGTQVWVLTELTPEGQAAATQLSLTEGERIVSVDASGDWHRAVPGLGATEWSDTGADDAATAARGLLQAGS